MAGSRRGSTGSRAGSPRVGHPGVRPYSPPAAEISRFSSSEDAQQQKEEAPWEKERPGRLQQGWSRQGSMSQRSDDSSDPWMGELQRLPAASVQLPEVAEQLSASQEKRGDLPLRKHMQHAELRHEGLDRS